ALEQDRAEDALVERGTADDPRAHRVHLREHLFLVRVRRLVDAVELERPGRAATTLVERGDEALAGSDAFALLRVDGHGVGSPVRWRDGNRDDSASRRRTPAAPAPPRTRDAGGPRRGVQAQAAGSGSSPAVAASTSPVCWPRVGAAKGSGPGVRTKGIGQATPR